MITGKKRIASSDSDLKDLPNVDYIPNPAKPDLTIDD
jgi:hypothetical protein